MSTRFGKMVLPDYRLHAPSPFDHSCFIGRGRDDRNPGGTNCFSPPLKRPHFPQPNAISLQIHKYECNLFGIEVAMGISCETASGPSLRLACK